MPTRKSTTTRAGKAPAKPGGGRQTVLSLKRLNDITNLLLAGNYVKTACDFAGIGETTFHKWRVRGETELDRVASLPRVNVDALMEGFEGDDPELKTAKGAPLNRGSAEYMWMHRPARFLATEWPFVVFQHQINRARAAAEVRIVNNIHQAAGKGQWQAGAWWLERTMPEKYGRRDRINLEGSNDGDPVKVEVVTVEDLNQKLERVLKGTKK